MNRNNLVAIGLVAVVLVGSAASFFLDRAAAPRPVERKPAEAPGARSAGGASSPSAIAKALVPGAAIPPPDAPLRTVLEDLKALAGKGNPAAACRLSFELERCLNLRQLQQQAARATNRAEQIGAFGEGRREAQAAAERAQETYQRVAAICEGVSNDDKADAWRHLLQAARAGHGPSMVRYAAGSGIPRGRETLEVLDGWIAFRDESRGFLDRAIEMGYPEAYEIGQNFYVRGGHWGLKVAPDRAKAVALQAALAEARAPGDEAAVERAIAHLVTNFQVTPDEVARGRAMAAPFAARLKARSTPASFAFDGTFRDDPGFCER